MNNRKKISQTFLIITACAFFSLIPSVITRYVLASSVVIRCQTYEEGAQIPIAGVKIELIDSKKQIVASCITGSSGMCEFPESFDEGKHYLKFSKQGYVPQTASRIFIKGKNHIFRFYLKRDKSLNHVPRIIRLYPEGNTVFLAGAKIKIKVKAIDPDNDALEYRFSVGGKLKHDWSKSYFYFWKTFGSDTGAVEVRCEVRDNKGAVTEKTVSLVIIDPTAEEILKKVSDNYAGVRDFIAEAEFFTTLNKKPFGAAEYCRYYFMAPDKEKTETYDNSRRIKKAHVIINNGSKMYIMDIINRRKDEIDLLEETGSGSGQFNCIDIYYNQDGFIDNHNFFRNDAYSNLKKGIICLEAMPKEPNSLYSKLGLCVDFNKGILTKYSVYLEDSLLQTIEVVRSKKMQQGIWLPVKMRKIPVLSEGELVTTVIYSKPKINSGLLEDDFDPEKQW